MTPQHSYSPKKDLTGNYPSYPASDTKNVAPDTHISTPPIPDACMMVHEDYSSTVGRTPIVRLNKLFPFARVYAKIEGRNPSFSVKDRIGVHMIEDAEQKGIITPGCSHIIEATSGNTGIALSFVAAARGYDITLTMPETMSIERRRLLLALGANLILTPGKDGMKGAVAAADRLAATDPSKYYQARQFENPANPAIHVLTTGPEIWTATDGRVDVVVSGVGTGGTLTGVSRYLKQPARKPDVLMVAVEPANSPVISQTLRGEPLRPGPHKIQGIGAGFLPETLDMDEVDKVVTVTDDDSFEMARQLMREEGILGGISSGAALSAVSQLVDPETNPDAEKWQQKYIVVILPSASERYMSTALFDGFLC